MFLNYCTRCKSGFNVLGMRITTNAVMSIAMHLPSLDCLDFIRNFSDNKKINNYEKINDLFYFLRVN